MPLFAFFIGLLLLVIGGGWLGLRIKPRPFPNYPQPTTFLKTIPLSTDLPAPVARYFKAVFGDQIPVIDSAVITGTAVLRPFGVALPSRFRFVYCAGQGYRHYIESTLFGYPVFKVNEYYLDGVSHLELPFATVHNQPKTNMAANLGLWGESVWLPSIFLTDPRVRWEAIDDHTARLIVPFEDGEDSFTVGFDPQTGLMRTLDSMRYQSETDSEKIGWHNEVLGWKTFHGIKIPSPSTILWRNQKVPWSEWHIEDVAYNVDVGKYICARGL